MATNLVSEAGVGECAERWQRVLVLKAHSVHTEIFARAGREGTWLD